MIRTTLLALFSITPCISCAMEQSDPLLIAEKFRTIPILEQKKFQDSYALWKKIAVTTEFINCIEILQQNKITAELDYDKAYAQLETTKEYIAYISSQTPLQQKIRK